MALFVLENTSADQNLNWLLPEGYTIDGVEVLDDDEEGYTGNSSDDIHIDKAKYERMSREEKAKIDQETADELGEIEDRLETANVILKLNLVIDQHLGSNLNLLDLKRCLLNLELNTKLLKVIKAKLFFKRLSM